MPISHLPNIAQKTNCTQNVPIDVIFHLKYVPAFLNNCSQRYFAKSEQDLMMRFFWDTLYYEILRHITTYYDILRHITTFTTKYDISRHITTYYDILRQITCFTVEKHFLSKISSFKRIYSQICRQMSFWPFFRFCCITAIFYDILRNITTYYDILRHITTFTTKYDISRHITTYYDILRHITTNYMFHCWKAFFIENKFI